MSVLDVVFLIFNVLLAIFTILINVFVMVAVLKTTQLHTPGHVLIFNLALADLGVGILSQPVFIVSIITKYYLVYVLSLSCLFFGGVSLVGVTVVLWDRYLALSLHLRYQVVITTSRAIVLACSLWVIALAYVIAYMRFPGWTIMIGIIAAVACFVTSIITYYRMYTIIKRHKTQIQAQTIGGTSAESPQKGRARSIKTSVWVQFVFILCWLPLVVVVSLKTLIVEHLGLAGYTNLWILFVTLFLSKSLANPLLYCWRVEEIRKAVFKVSKKIKTAWCQSREDFPK